MRDEWKKRRQKREQQEMKQRIVKWLALALLLKVGVVQGVTAENTSPGIAVGAKAPAFSLGDQSGKTRALASFLGQQKKVALVFYRSADW